MCNDLDLFGDVIITYDDLNIWLDTVGNMRDRSNSSREHYAKTYDIENKIKSSKLNGSFKKLITQYNEQFTSEYQSLELFATQYVNDVLDIPQSACPAWFHVCDNSSCTIYKQRIKHDKNRAIYQAKKQKARC